jgi:hypothetical protein
MLLRRFRGFTLVTGSRGRAALSRAGHAQPTSRGGAPGAERLSAGVPAASKSGRMAARRGGAVPLILWSRAQQCRDGQVFAGPPGVLRQ